MKRVEVEWLDPQRVLEGWTSRDEIDDQDVQPRRCTAVGYLFRDDDTVIVLVSSDNGHEVGDGLSLPRGCVTAVHELNRSDPAIRAA